MDADGSRKLLASAYICCDGLTKEWKSRVDVATILKF